MSYDFPNNNPELKEEMESSLTVGVIDDPYCPFCRGIGVIFIPKPLMNGEKLIGYKSGVVCNTCYATVRSFGHTPEEAIEDAKKVWGTRYQEVRMAIGKCENDELMTRNLDSYENQDWFGIKPIVDVPKVKVLDPEGNVVLRGWYAMWDTVAPSVGKKDPKDVAHIVITTSFADYGMSTKLEAIEVTPPHKIIIDE